MLFGDVGCPESDGCIDVGHGVEEVAEGGCRRELLLDGLPRSCGGLLKGLKSSDTRKSCSGYMWGGSP